MPPTIAVIGGGFAGAMTAAHLLTAAGPAARVLLFERAPDAGRGVAYATPDPQHVLNVPAGRMSAWPDAPDDFVAWLGARGLQADPASFQPRGRYGAYVADVLAGAVRDARRPFERIADEVVGLLPDAGRYRLRGASGATWHADRVVLAVGMMPPAPPARLAERLLARPWYVVDPWTPPALAPLPAGAEVLLVGTGLTAIDVALSLLDRGAARVHLASRRAMLPAPWAFEPPHPDWLDPATAPLRVSRLFRLVRDEVRRAEAAGDGRGFRAVLDALRPRTQALWQRLPWVEQRRFLRHARPWWEAARHRMPPPIAARVAALQAEGRLVVHAARIRGLEDDGDAGAGAGAGAAAVATLAARGGGTRTLHVARVVNCTGPEMNYRKIRHALALDLVGTGLARPSPIALGLDVTPAGRLRDEDGAETPGLWAVGSLRKGALWESTAVPELRVQARDVAAEVLASL